MSGLFVMQLCAFRQENLRKSLGVLTAEALSTISSRDDLILSRLSLAISLSNLSNIDALFLNPCYFVC